MKPGAQDSAERGRAGFPARLLTSTVSPSGRLSVHRAAEAVGSTTHAPEVQRILSAFALGSGHGLLHLGAAEMGTELGPCLSFWRELGRHFVGELCGALDPTNPETVVLPAAGDEWLDSFSVAAPPMRGVEFVTMSLLEQLWAELGEAAIARAAETSGGLQGYLESCDSQWHVAGRVCLHLAENKRDPMWPFAFVATYARHVPGREGLQHLPLSRALDEYGGAGDRQKLLSLLKPLQRAAEQSELIRELVDSGDVYHALAWTADEAWTFLRQAEGLQQAGVVVRLPDWWGRRRGRRPTVSVTVGTKPPSALGFGALLDVDLSVTLDGETLSDDEVDALLQASAGLVLIKGRWVEVDAASLNDVLEHWRAVQARGRTEGIGFAEALRLLAGAAPDHADEPEGIAEAPVWSEVSAGAWLGAQLHALRSPEALDAIEDGAGLAAVLRPYQKVGVRWLWALRALGLGGCLADDMGLGKTIQVIGLLSLIQQADGDGTDLLVVPASLVDNWRSELARFAPELKVLVLHSSSMPATTLRALDPSEVAAHDVAITTYGTAARTSWMSQYPWRSVVLDEAQAIKNPGSKQTRAIKKLPSGWRLALTGTPVENRLGDLWSLFDFLNPGLLGSAKDFGAMCKVMEAGRDTGYAPLRRLVAPYILRRLKTDPRVISDLPDKTEVTARCLLSREQAALYAQAVEELREALATAEGIERRGLVLAYLMRFKQICNHPSQWLGDGAFDPAHSGKFQRLTELCESIAERQDKVLVFTQFRTMTAPLKRHLADVFECDGLVLHGGTPVRSRQDLVQRFQHDEAVPFMILSLKAGGTGLNLTAANHVIHFDRWWNPAVENQATDRAYRIGQKRNVLVHRFVCQGTVEERIDELIESKQRLADEVLSGNVDTSLTEMSDDELLAIVRLDLHTAVTS